ncbi:hypothetical protein GF327_06405 [Candidatus Woesearchaeota archaeon]|nr:hypothetical protein [Candidatus Woesearchaeota archaeon]
MLDFVNYKAKKLIPKKFYEHWNKILRQYKKNWENEVKKEAEKSYRERLYELYGRNKETLQEFYYPYFFNLADGLDKVSKKDMTVEECLNICSELVPEEIKHLKKIKCKYPSFELQMKIAKKVKKLQEKQEITKTTLERLWSKYVYWW